MQSSCCALDGGNIIGRVIEWVELGAVDQPRVYFTSSVPGEIVS